jgi:hypothetical protein
MILTGGQVIFSCLFTDNIKRVRNALLTLCTLIHAIFKKSSFESESFDLLNTLMHFDEIEGQMRTLINHCSDYLLGKVHLYLCNIK